MAPSTSDPHYRLPTDVRPLEYRAHVTLHHERRVFDGTLALKMDRRHPSHELVLHGIELELRNLVYVAGDQRIPVLSVEAAEASETVTLRFASMMPAGEGTLQLDWSGKYSAGLRGLYLSGSVAATQFQAADARRVFPCFDEPLFKAKWTLSITAPEKLTVLANGKLAREEQGAGVRTHHFETTEVISSYLVALACGDLASSHEGIAIGVPVRTWAVPEKKNLTAFGQNVALEVLPRLQDYFGIPYAFGKVDQLGLADFESGAMENVGLITYREAALLLDPTTASLNAAKRIAEIITHELAHQWFGNWVTMVWWDDLWLNEAFATWMAYKIVDEWRPDWRVWLSFDVAKASALQLDALKSTHPVRSEILTVHDANEAFDLITYEKGGAVLRMLEAFLGEVAFRDGIRSYMRKFARSNAVADDLWSALAESSKQPVVELANAWIWKSGYPMVTVHRAERGVRLTQEQFFSEPGLRGNELWPVPVVLRYEDASGVHENRFLFSEAQREVTLPLQGELRWVVGNARSAGFFRVAYDDSILDGLIQNLGKLEAAEKVSLLSDQWALVRAGRREVSTFLKLAVGFRAETDYAVLDELVGRLAAIKHRMVSRDDLAAYEDHVRSLFEEQFEVLGWDPAPGEADAVKLRRAAVFRGLGVVGRSRRIVEEGRPRLVRVLEGDKNALEPNLHDPVLIAVMREGDGVLFDHLLSVYQREKDPSYRRRYLQGLASFESPDQVTRVLELPFSEVVQPQDLANVMFGILLNASAGDRMWTKAQEGWDRLLRRMTNTPMIQRLVVESFGNLRERQHLEQLRAFVKAHPLDAAKQTIAQTLERLTQDVELRERAMPQVSEWLHTQRR